MTTYRRFIGGVLSTAVAFGLCGTGCSSAPVTDGAASSGATPPSGADAGLEIAADKIAGERGLSTCTVSDSGTTVATIDFQTSLRRDHDGGRALVWHQTTETDRVARTVTVTSTVTEGNATLLATTTQSHGDTSSVDTQYGAIFGGVHHTFFASNGTTITGNVDGRRIVPIPTTVAEPWQYRHLRFLDGKPAPHFRTDGDVRRLLDQAEDAMPVVCANAPTGSGSGQTSGPRGGHQIDPFASTVPLPVTPFDPPTFAQPCIACGTSCAKTAGYCDAGVTASCIAFLFGYGACAAAGAAGCSVVFGICASNCDQNGGSCCPQACSDGSCCNAGDVCAGNAQCCKSNQIVCGGLCCATNITQCNQGTCCPQDTNPCGPSCCGTGQQCLNATTGACCPAGEQACGNVCCGAGTACLDPSTSTCCPAGQIVVPGGGCCDPTQVCNGACCQGGTCVNGTSCCYGNVTPGGQCCGFEPVCNGQCCNGSCTADGSCCSNGIVCGSACCGANQVCADAATSTCAAPTQPTLTLYDGQGNLVGYSGGPRARVGDPLTVTGQAFHPGTVTLSLDTVGGAAVGSAQAAGGSGSATFSVSVSTGLWPAGDHTLIAWESVGGMTVQGSTLINVQKVQ